MKKQFTLLQLLAISKKILSTTLTDCDDIIEFVQAFESRTQISLTLLREKLEALGFLKIKGDIVIQ